MVWCVVCFSSFVVCVCFAFVCSVPALLLFACQFVVHIRVELLFMCVFLFVFVGFGYIMFALLFLWSVACCVCFVLRFCVRYCCLRVLVYWFYYLLFCCLCVFGCVCVVFLGSAYERFSLVFH